VPMRYAFFHNVKGRYVRLRADQIRTELVNITIPVYPEYSFGSERLPRGIEYATRIVIEIGYYDGDLPRMIQDLLEQREGLGGATGKSEEKLIKDYFKGPLHFNKENEILRERDEEILIPHTDQKFKGEQVLRTITEGLRIPYEEKDILNIIPESINIPLCMRVEIQYKPSMLDYYYPYEGQRSLLNAEERGSLQSVKTIIVEDQESIKSFIDNINKGAATWLILRETNVAQVSCYREAEGVASFCIYDDDSVVAYERGRFVYPEITPGLRKLTPQINPFEIRIQCAANLRNLWHRLRLNYIARKTSPPSRMDSSDKTEISYPVPTDWCDSLMRACRTIKMWDQDIIEPHICPGTGENKRNLAKNYYAMNPNCKYDSPSDMVLLFETKAGWNQHGGPELFAFDNHDPKGGCVLLNDGTVKFIRTTEELQQLRWK